MEKRNKSDAVKKSLVLSGLVGTAGLFVAKMLGLVYSIPLSSILGSDAYMSYYGTAYRIYSYILNIFTAGFPFAIATLVAKYSALDDFKSLRKIKTVSQIVMAFVGLLGMGVMFLLSWPLSYVVAEGSGVVVMGTCLRILSLAIFFVPILSSYRGFWQGRKEMSEYAFSQVFEQIFRVGFLLTTAWVIVYVLKQDRAYALYMAVMSTSIAAIAGIIQIYFFDKENYAQIITEARHQTRKTVSKRKLLHEFISLAMPYLLAAVLGYSDDVYNSVLLPLGLKLVRYTSVEQDIILSSINYVGTKITAIPMILAPGFTAALIPHITSARQEGDYKKIERNVLDCINIIVYVGLPVSFCITLYALDIYHILFYTSDPMLSSGVLRWMAIEGFLGTLVPVITNIMMALGLKKDALHNLFIYVILKGICLIGFLVVLGYPGIALSTIPSTFFLIVSSMRKIHHRYRVRLKSMYAVIVKSIIGLIGMGVVCVLLKKVGIDGTTGRKLFALGKSFVNVSLSLTTYFLITNAMKTPRQVFHTDIISAVKRRLGK